MARKLTHDDYDAEVILTPLRGETTQAHALFKLTYEIGPGTCVPAPAEPLLHDWRDPELERPKIGGSDFWLAKPFTDLVIRGRPRRRRAGRCPASRCVLAWATRART